MFRYCTWFALMLLVTFAANLRAEDAKKEKPDSPGSKEVSPEELEDRFAEKLSGAVLEGSFTADDQPSGETPKPDRYKLGTVKKGKNGYFLIEANIGEGDAPFRMPVLVKWAGDTPVITLTNVLIPGFGTFTARVLFYEDRYAGTWQGGSHGGTMFGRIVRDDEAAGESAGETAQATKESASK
ncbi:MAG: hypothetical protein KF708_02895 [Pirellulales bacterium]|nr:hypothetical protein [Pirellulales bacterium]